MDGINSVDEDITLNNNDNQRELAIKVFKTSLNEFSNRYEYVEGDHRYDFIGQLNRQNNKKIVEIWAEKEMKNLTRIFRSGIPSPQPIRLDKNVLVMTFIGEDGWSAPQLADLDLKKTPSRARKCFLQALLLLRAFWERCKLVHADFSEYNVLYFNGTCYVVDVGQAVERNHPNAIEFLRRDIFNIMTFFSKCRTCKTVSEEIVDEICFLVTSSEPNKKLDKDGLIEWSEFSKQRLGDWVDEGLVSKFAMFMLEGSSDEM